VDTRAFDRISLTLPISSNLFHFLLLITTGPGHFFQTLTVANSHSALWPLFHYLLWQDVATEHASADANYEYYEQVRSVSSYRVSSHPTLYPKANQAFATRLASVLKPGDLVWVHDYHLLLVPRMLRNAMHSGAISGVGGENGGDVCVFPHERGPHGY
jgi:trehalose 6-phosphate synthase/phosphatase